MKTGPTDPNTIQGWLVLIGQSSW